MSEASHSKPLSTVREVFAAMLDFIFVLVGGGYAIGDLTGGLTEDGFDLKGGPASSCSR